MSSLQTDLPMHFALTIYNVRRHYSFDTIVELAKLMVKKHESLGSPWNLQHVEHEYFKVPGPCPCAHCEELGIRDTNVAGDKASA